MIEAPRRQSTGLCRPSDVVAEVGDEVEELEAGELEGGVEPGAEIGSVTCCGDPYEASSDALYFGALTYPWTWSLSILLTTT